MVTTIRKISDTSAELVLTEHEDGMSIRIKGFENMPNNDFVVLDQEDTYELIKLLRNHNKRIGGQY